MLQVQAVISFAQCAVLHMQAQYSTRGRERQEEHNATGPTDQGACDEEFYFELGPF